jgi:caffeoyl-CoA O-methyltransferase
MDLQAVEEYAITHTSEESPLLEEIAAKTRAELEYSEMLSGRMVGRLLSILIKISGAKRILEVGTFTGYSALTMAEALPADGEIFTCEYNERYEKIARSFFEKSEFGSKITLLMGAALDTIPTMNGNFDFAYLDADKNNYPNYYEMILPRLKRGGIMVIDNVLWSGEVLSPETENAKTIDKLNKMIKRDQSVEQVMLTVRDGLTVVRKK